MDLASTIEHMPETMYLRLKCAAETGKWPEGTVVDKAQRNTALQLIMAYQAKHLNSDEMLSIGSDGQIVNKNKRQLKAEFNNAAKDEPITPCVKPNIAHFTDI
ncbi:MAG: DUF1315 family protein [Litorilituus sp.]|jgi:hypothetical protein|nr:DUF1315 family protein [Litorilituus sp.]